MGVKCVSVEYDQPYRWKSSIIYSVRLICTASIKIRYSAWQLDHFAGSFHSPWITINSMWTWNSLWLASNIFLKKLMYFRNRLKILKCELNQMKYQSNKNLFTIGELSKLSKHSTGNYKIYFCVETIGHRSSRRFQAAVVPESKSIQRTKLNRTICRL